MEPLNRMISALFKYNGTLNIHVLILKPLDKK